MSPPPIFQLIIFDCDGVLIDSELIAAREQTRALNKIGFPITQSEIEKRFTGVTSAEMYAELEVQFGQSIPAGMHDDVKRAVLAAFTNELEPITGIHDILPEIRGAKCVASSSIPAKLEAGLKITGLYDWFAPHIFSATQVPRGKPAPDLFHFAAGQMSANPARCVVIEDSVAGVRAGVAAGMTTIGFTGGSHCPPNHAAALREHGAATTFSDMSQLTDIIAAMSGN